MTREEARAAIKVMEAYANGKKVQRTDLDDNWFDCENPNFDWASFNYRIKPEPKYRPFKTQEECWDEMHKHPDFGWVKSKSVLVSLVRIDYKLDGDLYFTINGTGGNCAINTNYMFECYTFADGEPFGVKEE